MASVFWRGSTGPSAERLGDLVAGVVWCRINEVEGLPLRMRASWGAVLEEFLIHWGYRKSKGSLGVEARLGTIAAWPRFTMRLPRDIRYDIGIFVEAVDTGFG
jgi:hypothetical protein